MGCPARHGDHFFYYYNSGLQNQSVLYIKDSIDGEARVFLDPNVWSEEGTIALSGTVFSNSNKKVAFLTQEKGSDWKIFQVKDVESGEILSDKLYAKYTSVAWAPGDDGFFYCGFERTHNTSDDKGTETTSAKNQKVYFHRLGTSQEDDQLVYEGNDPDLLYGVNLTDDEQYLLLS